MKHLSTQELDNNCEALFKYLVKLKKSPLVLSLKDLDVKFQWHGKEMFPSKESSRKALAKLEKEGRIEWKRTGKYKMRPEIIIKK